MTSSYTYETIELLRSYIREWSEETDDSASKWQIDFYIIEVGFSELGDDAERRYFSSVPTTFTLPDTTIDKLTNVGGRILRESSSFREFVEDLGGELPQLAR